MECITPCRTCTVSVGLCYSALAQTSAHVSFEFSYRSWPGLWFPALSFSLLLVVSGQGSKAQLLFQPTRYFSPPPSSSFELLCPLQLTKQTTSSPTFITYTNSAALNHSLLHKYLGSEPNVPTLTNPPPCSPQLQTLPFDLPPDLHS